jgi:hypothetical protein
LGRSVADWLDKRRNKPAVLYTQTEHSDFFSPLKTVQEVKQMHLVISGLLALSRYIKRNLVVERSEGECEYRPLLLRWDESLPFDRSEAFVEAFKKHIGWKLPELQNGHDDVGDALEVYDPE